MLGGIVVLIVASSLIVVAAIMSVCARTAANDYVDLEKAAAMKDAEAKNVKQGAARGFVVVDWHLGPLELC